MTELSMKARIVAPSKKVKRIHPKKFALWISSVSIVMLFAALTSAYMVRRAADDWYEFDLPSGFYYSTAAILGSSLLFHGAYKAYFAEKYQQFKVFFATGFVLGLLFVILQYFAWIQLQESKIFLTTNQSSSFLYLITGVHAFHVLGGIAALVVLAAHVIRKRYDAFAFSLDESVIARRSTVRAKRLLRLELIFTYWHFVDFLWVYLLIFFLVQ